MKTIWIVQGRCGEYSDAQEWPVAWCATEATANRLRDQCAIENASLTEDERCWYRNNDGAKLKMKSDPHWRTDYTGTEYSVYSLERWEP